MAPQYSYIRTLLALVLSLGFAAAAHADGTEALGPLSTPLAAGSDLVSAGTGLLSGASTIEIEVPTGVSVAQILLCWTGFHTGPVTGSDDTALVNGVQVVGVLTGGPTLFFSSTYCSAFRADVTNNVTLNPGTNSVAITGLDFDILAHGASLFVVVDDGQTASELFLTDGLDMAFHYFTPPLDTTQPQSFLFSPLPTSRTATLQVVVADVQANRPNSIRIETDGVVTDHPDLLGSTSGAEWDHLALDVPIGAGVSSLSVQVLSGPPGGANLPSSFAWVASALVLQTPPSGDVSGTIWLDANDNGVEDSAEVGIAGVPVVATCAGNDGILGTADDYTETQVSGALGDYVFSNLPIGPCQVAIDAIGMPVGLGPGICPMQIDLSIFYGVVAPNTNFCLVPANVDFVRGDSNDDGIVDVSDVVFVARWVAAAGVPGGCYDAADTNNDVNVDLADAVFLAMYLFAHGPVPAAPFPACGPGRGCLSFANCP
ncbi:MAG: SdrD B-like domain-containing protein [Planctomycetota bacterium]